MLRRSAGTSGVFRSNMLSKRLGSIWSDARTISSVDSTQGLERLVAVGASDYPLACSSLQTRTGPAMPNKIVSVSARIDEDVFAEANEVLNDLGVTMPFVFRGLIEYIAREKKLPFELTDAEKSTVPVRGDD